MISYSRKAMEKGLASDRALWRRVPASLAALFWPLLAISLGWGTGLWVGLLALLLLSFASILLPGRITLNLYLLDGLEKLLRLPLKLGWLLLVWHLALREPLFPILGQPILGAILVAAGLFLFTTLITFAISLAFGKFARSAP